MASVNEVTLLGNLGSDPDLRYTSDGTPVCNFSLATNERWTSQDGKKGERVEWHRVVAWRRTAELCSEYLAKGRQVYIKGKLQTRQWPDKEGVKHYTTEVVVKEVQFLGSRTKDKNSAPPDSVSESSQTESVEEPF